MSSALHYGGGYTEHLGDGDTANINNWFLTKNGLNLWVQSHTWAYTSSSPSLYAYQIHHIPGGVQEGTATGTAGYSYTGLSAGDLLFYDWDGNLIANHVGMQTTAGFDPNWVGGHQLGDLEDQHLTDRRRVWWALSPYNPLRNTTIITFVHILPTN